MYCFTYSAIHISGLGLVPSLTPLCIDQQRLAFQKFDSEVSQSSCKKCGQMREWLCFYTTTVLKLLAGFGTSTIFIDNGDDYQL